MIRRLLLFFSLLCSLSFAQVVPGPLLTATAPTSSISGQLQTPTGGLLTNGTLQFTLSQSAVVSGTSSVAPSTVSCYTSSLGNVVGVPDPLVLPITSTNTASGTLAAGTYYVEIAYVQNGAVYSLPSPEATVILTAQGTINVTAPVVQPASASGFAVYIGSTSGAETLQGTVTGWTQFQQSSALVNGAAPQTTNNSACNLWFSDSLIPSGTFYTVNLLSKNGSQIAGYPQTWCTYGGNGGNINVSQGTPSGSSCGTNGVFYPTPILASPGSTTQTINGNLTVTGSVSAQNQIPANVKVCTGTTLGSDLGAKINTLDAALGANTSGEIWIDQSCGTTATTQPISVATQGFFHVLRFVQGGTYTFNVPSPAGGVVISSPSAPVSTGAGGGFVIKGTGADTILRFLGTATYAYNIPCSSSPEHFKIDLTGATSFNGITSGGTSGAHCQFTNVNDVRINGGNGIGFNPGCFNDYWTIHGLWVTNVTQNDGAWIGCLSTNMNISGSHFNNNGGNGLDLGGCSQCKVVDSEMIGNGTLGGSCSGLDRAGIFIAADNTSNGSGIGNVASENVITGNYIARNWTMGIQEIVLASGTVNNSTIVGNNITTNGQCGGGGGVQVVINNANVTWSNNLITGNNIHDNTGWGLQLVSSGGTFTSFSNNDLLRNTYVNNTSGTFSIDNFAGVLGNFIYYELNPGGTPPQNPTVQDVCYGDSTIHALKCAYNNKNYHLAPIVEQGSCAMSAGTTCTFSVPFGFTAATTYVSLDAGSTPPGTANAAKCAISGTTVTITAASSNSLTWDCMVVGNPD